MSDDRSAVLAEFDDAWRRMRAGFEALAADGRDEPVGDSPVTLAQAVRHVADWDRLAAETVAAMADRGEEPEDVPDGIRNARWLAADLYVSLDDALRQLDDAHDRRRRVSAALSDDGWRRTEGGWLHAGTEHYRDHTKDPFDYPIDRDECLTLVDQTRSRMLERLQGEIGSGAADATTAIPLGAAIAHIARWDEGAVEVIRARQRNADAPDPYAPRYREWNARWLEADRGAAAEPALQRLTDASHALLDALRSLDEPVWRRDGPRYALGTAEHYRSHTDDPLEIPLPE